MTKFFSKRFKSIKTCCLKTNTAKQNQNLKIGQKLLKHTKNILEKVFVTKQQNTFLSIKNFLFKSILSKNASSQLKLLTNIKYSQTALNLKLGQKLQKLIKITENR